MTIFVKDYDDVKEMMDDKIPSGFQDTLGKIKYRDYLDEDDDLIKKCFENDLMKESAKSQIEMMGADDFAHGIVDFSLGHDDYYLMLEFVEYDDKWFIAPAYSFLTSVYGLEPSKGNMINQDEMHFSR